MFRITLNSNMVTSRQRILNQELLAFQSKYSYLVFLILIFIAWLKLITFKEMVVNNSL